MLWQGVDGIEMAKFAAGFCFLLGGRVIWFGSVYTSVVYFYYLLVRKFFLRKRRDHMALITTVDLFCYWIMGNLLNIGMTFLAGNGSVNSIFINSLIDVVIDPFAIFINSAKESILMAHEAIIFISRFSIRAY